jgi:hypothetical protein
VCPVSCDGAIAWVGTSDGVIACICYFPAILISSHFDLKLARVISF